MQLEPINVQSTWDAEAERLGAHPLQLWKWADVKVTHGWSAERLVVRDDSGDIIGGAQVLLRPLPKPFGTFAYIPRGPFGSVAAQQALFTQAPRYFAQYHRLLCISAEPEGNIVPTAKGWRPAKNTILMNDTVMLDLTKTDDELLADMKKKTRQYIRKSQTATEIRQLTTSAEINDCLTVYKATAKRAQFGLHNDDYYHTVSEQMGEQSVLYGAYYNNQLASFLWLIYSNQTAFELYGGVTEEGQTARVNYVLKWHAIRDMKQRGVSVYDLNGLLEGGVSSFKQGFASAETHLSGTFDYPMSPLYSLWSNGLPLAKKIYRSMRRR